MVRYSEFNEDQNEDDNEDKIRSLLKEYFVVRGRSSIENGLININGDVELIKHIKLLPVKFGKISGNFDCNRKQLTSLVGSPSHVGGTFNCSDNQLTSLIGSPSHVVGNFYCNHNQLTSLIGSPLHISGDFDCYNNPLISLEGIPDNINRYIYIDWNKDLPLLRLLKYKQVFLYENDEVRDIINKYCKLGFSRSNLLACQRELIDAGYESNAKW